MDIKKHDNDASMDEFMKFSLEGFSWAENICQRVESLCTENNMIQNPGKYVNAVGEHFKKVLHTVVNDFCDNADDLSKSFSELSTVPVILGNMESEFESNTSDEMFSAKSKFDEGFSSALNSLTVQCDGSAMNKRSTIEIEENISIEEVISSENLGLVKLPREPQFLNEKEAPLIEAEGLNCLAENFANSAQFDGNSSRFLSQTKANSSMGHKSSVNDGLLPFHSICMLDLESQEESCSLESNASKFALKEGYKEAEISTKYENLGILGMEDFGNSSIFSLKNEDLNEFEDVKLEDDFEAVKVDNEWDDVVMSEIALISSMAAKKESSKKKLKKILTSRWRRSRCKELASYQVDLHSKTTTESDWELL